MTFRIPRGKHRARPFRFGLWWNRNHFAWNVQFNNRCIYNLYNDDQLDTNKLIGIGYLPNHHKDSARFGWRYDTEKNRIELSAYCYINGQRIIEQIANCEIGRWYSIRLHVTNSAYVFEVDLIGIQPIGHAVIQHYHEKKLQYRLGFSAN